MRVLVTGGAGFIGSHLVDGLLEKGYEVTILDSLEKPVHTRGKPDYIPKEVRFILGDVRNREDVDKALQGTDAVFHLAAYQDYLPDFSKFFHINTVGTALLFELIVEKKYPIKRFILASSQAVYGEGKYHCPNHGVVYPPPRSLGQLMRREWEIKCPTCGSEMTPQLTDESVVNPHNQYAISKYTQELIALNLGKRYDIPTVVLRYSITQGPRQSFFNAYSGICRIFCTSFLSGQRPVIYEDGQQLRDYVYIDDVTKANLLVLEEDEANDQIFSVGGGRQTTVVEYAHFVASKLGQDFEVELSGRFRLGDTRHIISDISKLKSLGWEPVVPVEQIIEKYLQWLQTQPNIKDYYAAAERIMEQREVIRTGL